jgi:uncharacterized membrane protein YGL010W
MDALYIWFEQTTAVFALGAIVYFIGKQLWEAHKNGWK